MKATTIGCCMVLAACVRESGTTQPDANGEPTADSAIVVDASIPPLVAGGELAWAKRGGGSSYDGVAGIGTLADGSSLLVGRYASSAATFGTGEANETTLPASPYGEYDVFLARFNPNGTLAWARRIAGGPTFQDDVPSDLVVFGDGSSLVAGSYEGTTTFDGETQDITLTGSNGSGFLARIDANGYALWAVSSIGGQLSALPDGTVTSVSGGAISRHAANGSHVWTKTVTSDFYVAMHDVGMLPDGSAVVTGELSGTVVFGAGETNQTTLVAGTDYWPHHAFVAKYAADGSLAWARTAAAGSATAQAVPHAIAVLADGSFAITGYFGQHAEQQGGLGNLTFGPGQPNATTLPHQALDVFVAKFAANGTLQWARRGASSGHEFGQSIAATADGTLVITGWFGIYNGTTLTFGTPPHAVALVAAGDADSFVASFTADGYVRWAKRFGGDGRNEASRAALFSDGAILVAGDLGGTATFGDGEAAMTMLTAVGNADPFVAKFRP